MALVVERAQGSSGCGGNSQLARIRSSPVDYVKTGADVNMGIERKHWTITTESGRSIYKECQVPEAAKKENQ